MDRVETRVSVLPSPTSRLVSVDILRGLVMVIMALDHTRDFMWEGRFAPEDLAHTNGALFFTRFITHFCAPVFAFLAGTGAYLSTRRGKSLRQVSWFFLARLVAGVPRTHSRELRLGICRRRWITCWLRWCCWDCWMGWMRSRGCAGF
jgi:uncharacterized membrane protein